MLTFGSDSLALDIQRSRDHGLAGYTKYLKLCTKNAEIETWEDLQNVLHSEDLEIFKALYKSPADIDLMVGALAEISSHDAMLGPTLQCIIGTSPTLVCGY